MFLLRFVALLVLGASAFAGTPSDSAYAENVYATNITSPTSLAFAPDGSGRLFVTLKNFGVVVIGPGGQGRSTFVQFPQVYTESECGVLGFAFDPDYATNHYVYVFLTVSASEQRIVRLLDVNNRGLARVNIVRGLPTRGLNHDGGALTFGADGRLYWGVGDNGAKVGVDADLRSFGAKIGRATRSGVAPQDNPFFDGPGGSNDFVWASGVRNPFKMLVQPATGLLWLQDVGSSPGGQTEPRSGPGFEQLFALQAGDDCGYDDFEGNQPDAPRYTLPKTRPLAKPVLQYRTDYENSDISARRSVTGITSLGDREFTFATTSAVPFHVGEIVTFAPASGAKVSLTVKAVVAGGFVGRANVDLADSTGNVAPLAGNGCVTGGVFYESSLLPASARGSLFFGDFISSTIFQVPMDDANHPRGVTPFVTNAGGPTDMAVGPDGALYYASYYTNTIRRVGQASASAQALLVTPTTLRVLEGIPACFTVRLLKAPTADVPITITRTAGDAGVSLMTPATLSFTAQNWQTPQVVKVVAEVDADADDNSAEFTLSGVAGAPVVRVFAKDIGADSLVLSASSLRITERETGSFTVALPALPPRPVTLTVRRTKGSRYAKVVAGARLKFTPENWDTPQTVLVRVSRDRNEIDNTATISLSGGGYWSRPIEVTLAEP